MVGNRRKRFYGEMWGNTFRGGGTCKNPWDSLRMISVYDGLMETAMLNTCSWTFSACQIGLLNLVTKLKKYTSLGVHKTRRSYGWWGWTKWNFEPAARFSIWWHNLVKRGFMYSKQNWKWMLARLWKNENIGS